MLPKYRKIGAKLPLFAQGRADLLRDGQFEEISLFAIGQRDCGLALFQQGQRWIGFISGLWSPSYKLCNLGIYYFAFPDCRIFNAENNNFSKFYGDRLRL